MVYQDCALSDRTVDLGKVMGMPVTGMLRISLVRDARSDWCRPGNTRVGPKTPSRAHDSRALRTTLESIIAWLHACTLY